MSSVVFFRRSGVVAEWHKDRACTVTVCNNDDESITYYPTREKAIAAAEIFASEIEAAAGRPAAPLTAYDIHDVIRLARAFGEEVQGVFSTREFRAICERNKSGGAYDHGACATHDFCDANMLMLAAFTATFDREPWFLTDSEHPKGVADTRLWNDAWAVAKAAEFFA